MKLLVLFNFCSFDTIDFKTELYNVNYFLLLTAISASHPVAHDTTIKKTKTFICAISDSFCLITLHIRICTKEMYQHTCKMIPLMSLPT